MKTILIDENQSSLQHLKKTLSETDLFNIISTYTNPLDALEAVHLEKPDIIFMDTELSLLSGIVAAKHFQSSLPQVHIVFVTARHTYAIQAFEINALDFILKPIQPERLIKTMQKLKKYQKLFCSDFV